MVMGITTGVGVLAEKAPVSAKGFPRCRGKLAGFDLTPTYDKA